MGCDPAIAVVRRKFATGCTAVVHAESLNLDIVMAKLEDRVSTSDFGLMKDGKSTHPYANTLSDENCREPAGV
jgi:hypothetical protein